MKSLVPMLAIAIVAGCAYPPDNNLSDCSQAMALWGGPLPDDVREGVNIRNMGLAENGNYLYQVNISAHLGGRLLGMYLTTDGQNTISRVPLRMFVRPNGIVYTQFIAERSGQWNVAMRVEEFCGSKVEYIIFDDEQRP